MPAAKKHASARARANRAATAADLVDVAPEDRSGWKVAELRREIDARNVERAEDDRISKGGTRADLVARLLEDDYAIPVLPERRYGWHEMTQAWWRDVWMSPMSKEWHPETDYHNVVVAAMHYDDMWNADKALERQKAAAAMAKMVAQLGLTPYDRRRLEWTIASATEATGRVQRRSDRPAPESKQKPQVDPRAGLHAV